MTRSRSRSPPPPCHRQQTGGVCVKGSVDASGGVNGFVSSVWRDSDVPTCPMGRCCSKLRRLSWAKFSVPVRTSCLCNFDTVVQWLVHCQLIARRSFVPPFTHRSHEQITMCLQQRSSLAKYVFNEVKGQACDDFVSVHKCIKMIKMSNDLIIVTV